MERLFIDTDVALDLLSGRDPHYNPAAELFSMADSGKVKLYISPLSISNLNYLLSRQYDKTESRRILNSFKVLVSITSIDAKIIDLALSSKFNDLEDAIQYFTAVEYNIPILITRNTKDYKFAKIPVMSAQEFISRFPSR